MTNPPLALATDLRDGDFTMLLADHEQVYASGRRHGAAELLVLANFSELVLSNLPDPQPLADVLTLRPWEVRVQRRS